jgi:hypothetical protein
MQSTEFYLNGYTEEGGDILSFSITNKIAIEAIELQKDLGDKDLIARIQTEDTKWFILVDSITTSPIEDLSTIEEEDTVAEILVGNKEEYLPNWYNKVNAAQKAAERKAANAAAWDAINVDHYPIDVIRKYFDSYNITGSMGYSYNKKPFKTFDISVVPDMEIAVKGELIDTKFGINAGHLKDGEKIYKILKAWNNYENLMAKIAEMNDNAIKEGFEIEATYGVASNELVIKIADTECGADYGFETVYSNFKGVNAVVHTCSSLKSINGRLEHYIWDLRSHINSNIPTLYDVLK